MSSQASTPQLPKWAEKVEVYEFKGVKKFYDIMPVLADRMAFAGATTDLIKLTSSFSEFGSIDAIVCTEARGFLFGSPVARVLGVGVVAARKPGKLPGGVVSLDYIKEYERDTLEIQRGLLEPGTNVVVVDDLVATGGTPLATAELARKLGWNVLGIVSLIELAELGARKRLEDAGYNFLSAWRP